MSSLNCEFCGKTYSAKKSLVLHQTTAKFCLKIQSENKHKKEENETVMKSHEKPFDKKEEEFKCEFCEDNFTLRSSLKKHYERCKIRNKTLIAESQTDNQQNKTQIAILQTLLETERKNTESLIAEKDNTIKNLISERDNLLKQLFELKSTPTINNTTNYNQSSSTKVANICNVNNKLPLTKEFFTKLGDGIDFIKQKFRDEKDICRYTLKQGLNKFVLVLDKSRKVLTFTDEKGNTIRDQDGVKLANQLYEELSTRLEGVQEYLEEQKDDPSEYYVPTTLDRRKKIVEWILSKNPDSLQRFGKAYFTEYSKFDPNHLSLTSSEPQQNENTLTDETKSQVQFKVESESQSFDNFPTFKTRLKNIFYKYNFNILSFGLYTIGGFVYQFKDELEMIVDDEDYILKILDDAGQSVEFNKDQFFNLLKSIFTEEDFINIVHANKSLDPAYTRNAIRFNTIFILKTETDDNLVEDVFRGITNNYEY